MKRLAVFLDGTWNAVGTNTNVWRMRCLCADTGTDGITQLRFYHNGVNGFIGGGWGKGLSENVCLAYDWIVDNYEDGDEIFIFGFSRGAFTARSLAGFIATCGLLKPGGPLGVNQLFDRYKLAENDRTIYKLRGMLEKDLSLEEKWLLKYSRETLIKVVGVWDTVGALGVPVFSIPGFSSSTFSWHHTGLRTPIQHGFHAVAIDEHRKKFAPTLWTIRTPVGGVPASHRSMESVEQRWFVGAHANVGGGCYDDLLAQIPLKWMINRAESCGLTMKRHLDIDGSEMLSPISDSYKEFLHGAYCKVSKRFYRPIGANPIVQSDGSHDTINETIDASVFERWRSDASYRPKNLVDWGKRHDIDLGTLTASVMAKTPDIAVAN